MKRIIIVLMIAMTVSLTACGNTTELDPEVEQIRQTQIQYWDLFENNENLGEVHDYNQTLDGIQINFKDGSGYWIEK